jgi:sterol 3beta-glucosyltransferase
MNVSIVTSGSRGDVQPYIALGKGLKRAGYDVRLLGSDDFEELVREAGLAFSAMGPNIQAMLESDSWRQTLEGGNFLTILRKMRLEMKEVAADVAARLPSLLQGSDLIVTGMTGMGTFAVAEHLQIPVIEAYVFPFTPTAAFPSPLFPQLADSPLPAARLLNRLSFHLTRQMFWQNSKAIDSALRRGLDMKRGTFWGPFRHRRQQDSPILYGYSRHVLPRPRDWDERIHVTGYWFDTLQDGWAPPDDLLDFLQAGSPPVYVGFGSMGSRQPLETAQVVLEALARTGQRGLLAAGWGGLRAADLPPTVHLISSTPHSWLFPRMKAVVHHGGAGTTAAGLRAGVPSVIVPFMGDQPFWGQRVSRLGLGPAPIPRKELSAARLVEAIQSAVSDGKMRRRAAELGREIHAEDGVAAAVALIDGYRERV